MPQDINLKLSVESTAIADEILRLVKKPKILETIHLSYPYNMDDVNADEAVGIWADREAMAAEIARAIRGKNNGEI